MKIVQTPVRFFPAVGGVEKYVLDLSLQLIELGHQVTVICANEPETNCSQVKGIRVKRLPYIFKVAGTNITPSLLYKLLNEDFDIIHTHFPTPWSSEISLICAKIKKKPCILTYHNDVEKEGFLGQLTKIYNKTLLKFLLDQVNKILVTQPQYINASHYLTNYRNKIAVISNGMSKIPTLENKTQKKETLLFVGILDQHHRYKGLDYLIKALYLLINDWPEIRLDVIGEGSLISEYRVLAHNLCIEKHVCFHGYIEDQELSEFYRTSKVFILPSIDLHEGFGIVLLEAMAYGIPVITTNIVGFSNEIRQQDAGLIVPSKNPEELARAINFLLTNPQRANQMGENARKLIQKKYLWEDITNELVKVYEEFVK